MKKLCLVRTVLTDNTIQKLCNIMQNQYEMIIRCDDSYKKSGLEHPFTDEQLNNADVIIGNPSMKTLSKCRKLRWIQLASSGADVYAHSGLLDPQKTVLTNATGAYGHAIAEYMIACVFSMAKKLHLYRDNQTENLWKDMGFVKTIRGSRVLVVGLGDIGNEFAIKMHALGAQIYAIKRTITTKPDYVKELHTLDSLHKLLPEMDIVALCLPNSKLTQNVISEKELYIMKKDSILINVGRGNAVNTAALTDALANNIIDGAILDVTSPEPLPADHPLWKQKNAIITPHISGGYHAQETIEGIESIILENAQRYVKGEPLINQVDFETGYRKKIT